MGNPTTVRTAAAKAVGQLGGERAVPALNEAFLNADETRAGRRAIGQALGKIGPPAVPVLTEALTHENQEVREFAAYAIVQATGLMPDQAKASKDYDVPVSNEALKDNDETAREASANTLSKSDLLPFPL